MPKTMTHKTSIIGTGGTVNRYESEDQAIAACATANSEAERLGIQARYEVLEESTTSAE